MAAGQSRVTDEGNLVKCLCTVMSVRKNIVSYNRQYVVSKNKIFKLESVTATVELNAIAMKRGELAEYRVIEMPQPQFYPPPSLDFRGMYNQRFV